MIKWLRADECIRPHQTDTEAEDAWRLWVGESILQIERAVDTLMGEAEVLLKADEMTPEMVSAGREWLRKSIPALSYAEAHVLVEGVYMTMRAARRG